MGPLELAFDTRIVLADLGVKKKGDCVLNKFLSTLLILFCCFSSIGNCRADYTLIPMDETQSDHLKAYGLAYWALEDPRGISVEWLLNYRGGSFLINDSALSPREAQIRGVRYENVSLPMVEQIHQLM